MTGMTREVFSQLEGILFRKERHRRDMQHREILAGRRKNRGGRRFSIDYNSQLGLFLFYLGSKMAIKHLCMICGVTPSTCCRVIIKMLALAVRRLKHNEHAAIRFPSPEVMEEFAQMIQRREPMAVDVIGFMDGLSVPCECTCDEIVQNSFYNGYHSDTMVNNIFAYGPDGKVFLCAINFPGSWHDGAITYGLIAFLKEVLNDKKICVDQGFPRSGDAYDVLVGPYSAMQVCKLSPTL